MITLMSDLIEYHVSKLVGHLSREVTDVDLLADHTKRRGAFGNANEELHLRTDQQ